MYHEALQHTANVFIAIPSFAIHIVIRPSSYIVIDVQYMYERIWW